MDSFVNFVGTKDSIASAIIDYLPESNRVDGQMCTAISEFISSFVDEVEASAERLSVEENLTLEKPRSYASEHGFVSNDAVYYISLKKITYLLFSVITKSKLDRILDPTLSNCLTTFFEAQFEGEDLILFRKLNSYIGESCVILESHLNGKRGIDCNYYSRFRGECINNHIICSHRTGDRCLFEKKHVSEVCEQLVEDRVLRKKGNRYFYTDFL